MIIAHNDLRNAEKRHIIFARPHGALVPARFRPSTGTVSSPGYLNQRQMKRSFRVNATRRNGRRFFINSARNLLREDMVKMVNYG